MSGTEIRRGAIRPVECVTEGFGAIKGDFWLMLAISLVGALIGAVSMFIAAGAMTCGTFYCFLRKIDGKAVSFDDLWKGMHWFVPGLVLVAIFVIPMFIVYAMIYLPVILAAVMGSKLSQDKFMGLLVGAVAVDIIFIVLMVCVHTFLIFSFPLLVDRGMGVLGAMSTSAKAVFANLAGVAGLLALNFLLVLAGQLALCVGVYFVLPIIIAGNVVAYRKIFPPIDREQPAVFAGGI